MGASRMGGSRSADLIGLEGGEEFQGWDEIGSQGRLADGPGRGFFVGLVNHPTLTHDPDDHASVDEEEEEGHATSQRGLRPVGGTGQVVFEVQSGVAQGFGNQGFEMLVVPVTAEVGQAARPEARQLANG